MVEHGPVEVDLPDVVLGVCAHDGGLATVLLLLCFADSLGGSAGTTVALDRLYGVLVVGFVEGSEVAELGPLEPELPDYHWGILDQEVRIPEDLFAGDVFGVGPPSIADLLGSELLTGAHVGPTDIRPPVKTYDGGADYRHL